MTNEIKIIRLYNAPLKAVWDAWTDPQQVSQWWGPRGFTLTHHSKDLRTGGSWSYTMHGPDGVHYPNKTQYLEVEKYSRLVYDRGGNDERPPLFRVTVLFSEVKDKTKMDMTMSLPTPEEAAKTRKFVKEVGGDTTWDRLAEFLEEKSSGKDIFVINRTFDAPRETVFEMWTQPKHFSQWMAPKGFSMSMIKIEVKEGGGSFYSMTTETGNGPSDQRLTMHGKTQYLEIKQPSKIAYTQQFCDENENISRHPLAPTWPESMLTSVSFEEEGPHQTRVTLSWEVDGSATRDERETFHQAKAGMSQGWAGSFDKLEAYLEKLKARK